MIRTTKTILLLAALACSASTALADTAAANLSLHNAALPADVDNNGAVTIADLTLVFDVLKANQASPLVAPLESQASYLWDTSGNGRVNSQDALVVINYLLAPVPEPTTVVTAGLALAGFAGLCWRRRNAAALRS